MKIALVIVDMQKHFLQDRMKEFKVPRACVYINYVAELLRSKDHIVVHVQDVEGADESGMEAIGFIPEIEIFPGDLHVKKEQANAFWKTDLERLLQEKEVNLVIVAGFAAEQCVLFTYNGALERGFKAVMLQNGIISSREDIIQATYRDRDLISDPAIAALVE
ncbi:cysteine hydrolase family protein [Cohnella candidum]|uniref:Cysteine hydrolase n=1 Tax=Cohnella candidum TaxID=2674991 RepID=A0A3G3JYT7_9BACL|nr:isochorismatase family cysteine hydrolase [Cohnella candidum]AYQ73405.1 cysteine hydrolase [Cohnella candidum]